MFKSKWEICNVHHVLDYFVLQVWNTLLRNQNKLVLVLYLQRQKTKERFSIQEKHIQFMVFESSRAPRESWSHTLPVDWESTRPSVWSKKGIIWDKQKIFLKSILIATSNFCLDRTFWWDIPYICEAQGDVNLRTVISENFQFLAYNILVLAPFIPDGLQISSPLSW